MTIKKKDAETVYAEFTVEQKNYYPELISVDDEPVEWEESFGYFTDESATVPVSKDEDPLTYTNTFTFSLSDDFSKGTYLVTNMFAYKNAYSSKLEGGTYYADI